MIRDMKQNRRLYSFVIVCCFVFVLFRVFSYGNFFAFCLSLSFHYPGAYCNPEEFPSVFGVYKEEQR